MVFSSGTRLREGTGGQDRQNYLLPVCGHCGACLGCGHGANAAGAVRLDGRRAGGGARRRAGDAADDFPESVAGAGPCSGAGSDGCWCGPDGDARRADPARADLGPLCHAAGRLGGRVARGALSRLG